jgi:hypothetical protein
MESCAIAEKKSKHSRHSGRYLLKLNVRMDNQYQRKTKPLRPREFPGAVLLYTWAIFKQ